VTQALGMAPGLAKLTLYIGSYPSTILSEMTTRNPLPTTIGCSWQWTPADPSEADPYFQKMAVQGQTFLVASGDNATWQSQGFSYPADNPYIVSVGGTNLLTTGKGGPWGSETAWNISGGGISPNGFAIPEWQQLSGVVTSRNQGSTIYRNGPDVAAASAGFYYCANQTSCGTTGGGTSYAAPMWAGYLALVNQQRAANGKTSIGFLNPIIYSQNVTPAFTSNFHDITSGTSGSYSATQGYDLVTGWGSPNSGLIDALVNYDAAATTKPTVLTGSASAQADSAVLYGNIDPKGSYTPYWFLYGTDSGLNTPSYSLTQYLNASDPASDVNANITQLAAGTTYYYQLVATNDSGKTFGAVKSFKTTDQGRTPTLLVTPSAASISTSQPLTVSVLVSGNSGTPTGSVNLYWENFSVSSPLNGSGSAVLVIPAGVLRAGTDQFMVAYSGDGNYDAKTVGTFITVTAASQGPTARFTMSSQGQTANENGTLTATADSSGSAKVSFASNSTPGSSAITGYVWNSNGLQFCNSSVCGFPSFPPGTYAISLIVTDANGLTSTANATLLVNATQGPTAHFTMSSQGKTANENGTLTATADSSGSAKVSFASNSTPGSSAITGYVWNTNGLQFCNASVCGFPTFPPGTYAISLIVTDANGLTSTANATLLVNATQGPAAHFQMSAQGKTGDENTPLTVTANANGYVQVLLTSTSTPGSSAISSYVWKGNGLQICDTPTCNAPSFNPATYTISLKVTDMNGLAATANGTLVVTAIDQPPSVTTDSASEITSNSVILHGSFNPNGKVSTVWFRYGTDNSLVNAVDTDVFTSGTESATEPFNARLINLSGGTTYFYRLQAKNSAGPANGAILSFVTAGVPAFTVSGTATTIATGQVAGNSVVTVTPSQGFTGQVALTAVLASWPSGAQHLPTLSFGSTTPVNITSSSPVVATLTISTTASTSSNLRLPHPNGFGFEKSAVVLACLFLFGIPALRRKWRSMFVMMALFAALVCGVVGCGGGGTGGINTGGTPGTTGTTAGTYSVTVTATSGAIIAQNVISLTVR